MIIPKIFDPLQFRKISAGDGIWPILIPQDDYARLRIKTPDRSVLIPLIKTDSTFTQVDLDSFGTFWKGVGYSEDTVASYSTCLGVLARRPLLEYPCANNDKLVLASSRAGMQGPIVGRRSNVCLRNAYQSAKAKHGTSMDSDWVGEFASYLGMQSDDFEIATFQYAFTFANSFPGFFRDNMTRAAIVSVNILDGNPSVWSVKIIAHKEKQITHGSPLLFSGGRVGNYLTSSVKIDVDMRNAMANVMKIPSDVNGLPFKIRTNIPSNTSSFGSQSSEDATIAGEIYFDINPTADFVPTLTDLQAYSMLSTPSVYDFRLEFENGANVQKVYYKLPNNKIITEFILEGDWCGVATDAGLATDRLKISQANTSAAGALNSEAAKLAKENTHAVSTIMLTTTCSSEPFVKCSLVAVDKLELNAKMADGDVNLAKEELFGASEDSPSVTWGKAAEYVRANKMHSTIAVPSTTFDGERTATADKAMSEPDIPAEYADGWYIKLASSGNVAQWKAAHDGTEEIAPWESSNLLTPKNLFWVQMEGSAHMPRSSVDQQVFEAAILGSWGIKSLSDVSGISDPNRYDILDLSCFMSNGYIDWRGLSEDAQMRLLLLTKGGSKSLGKMEAQLVHTLDVASKSYFDNIDSLEQV